MQEKRTHTQKKRTLPSKNKYRTFSQNEERERNEELAKDRLWKISSDTLSLGRQQQHVLREVLGPSSYAIRNVTEGNFCECMVIFHK